MTLLAGLFEMKGCWPLDSGERSLPFGLLVKFCPTFDMLYLNVYLVQKCKKQLCCNLFWVPTQFDWTILLDQNIVNIDSYYFRN